MAAVKTPDEWIQLGIKYMDKREGGWTAKEFAEYHKVNWETMRKAFARHKQEITKGYSKQKTQSKREKPAIQQFRELIAYRDKNIRAAKTRSSTWFRNIVIGHSRNKVIPSAKEGRILTFQYNPKQKMRLKYWDKYPLILSLGESVMKNGMPCFYGINLHYTPLRERQRFIETMFSHMNQKSLGGRSKFNGVTWRAIKSIPHVRSMIKCYLPHHVQGKMVQIHPHEWANIMFLPYESFFHRDTAISKTTVWNDTISRG